MQFAIFLTQIRWRRAGSFILGLRGPAELGVAATTVTVQLNIPAWMVTQRTVNLSSACFSTNQFNFAGLNTKRSSCHVIIVGLRVQRQESNSVHPAHQLAPLVVLIILAQTGSLGSQCSRPLLGSTLLLEPSLRMQKFVVEPPAPLPSSHGDAALGETPRVDRRSESPKIDAVGLSRLLRGFLCRSFVQDV